MPDIVGIRFKKAGKVYYFDPAGTDLKISEWVVVQTARGVELGQVMITPRQVEAAEITAELKSITRKANPEDLKRSQDYAAKEDGAMQECAKIITRLNLPMKLVSSEYNLDGSRLTFYFTAEERVDFRELVRELTAFFKTRIELRQIGPRDQAKIVGGLGRCGRPLCCGTFLTEFTPVSIKMAKEQDLPLDPMKISGVCGRLQCCLAYESAQYREAKALMPRKGQPVETPAGRGVINSVFPLKESVLVDLETQSSAEFPLAQIKLLDGGRPRPAGPGMEETAPAAEKAVPAVEKNAPAMEKSAEAPKHVPQGRKTGVAPRQGAPSKKPLPPHPALPTEVDTLPVNTEERASSQEKAATGETAAISAVVNTPAESNIAAASEAVVATESQAPAAETVKEQAEPAPTAEAVATAAATTAAAAAAAASEAVTESTAAAPAPVEAPETQPVDKAAADIPADIPADQPAEPANPVIETEREKPDTKLPPEPDSAL